MSSVILVAPAGAGKDETFALLEPYGYRRYAFGDNIRTVCRILRNEGVQEAYCELFQMFNWNPPQNLWRKLEEFQQIPQEDTKDRKLLQELGTYCREYDDYIWVRPLRELAEYQSNMCITDCRRRSEFEQFLGFTSIYIDAPLELRLERLRRRDGTVREADLKHKAEQEIELLRDRCNYIVDNSGTLEELEKQLLSCLRL